VTAAQIGSVPNRRLTRDGDVVASTKVVYESDLISGTGVS
jgi:hypothetical protein